MNSRNWLLVFLLAFRLSLAQTLDTGSAGIPSLETWNSLSEEKKLSLAKQLVPLANHPEQKGKLAEFIGKLRLYSIKYFPASEVAKVALMNPKKPDWYLVATVASLPEDESVHIVEPLLDWVAGSHGDESQIASGLFFLRGLSYKHPLVFKRFKEFLKNPKIQETLRREIVNFSNWDPIFGRDPDLQEILFEIAENKNSSKELTWKALESLNSNRASKDRLIKLAQAHMYSQTPELAFEALKALGRLSQESSQAKQLLVFYIQNQQKNPKEKNLGIQGLAEDQDIIWKMEDLRGFQSWRSQPRCEVLCQMAQSVLERKIPKSSEFADYYDVNSSWNMALDSLDGLFLLKASKVCLNQKLSIWATEYVTKKTKPDADLRKKMKNEEFSAYKIYFEQFEVQALKEVLSRKQDFKLNPKEESQIQKKIDSSYSHLNEYFDREKGLGGSAMNVFAWACTLVSGCSGTPEKFPQALSYPGFQKAKTALENWTQANPISFPYTWSHEGRDSTKGSAARAVPANLAQFLFSPGTSVSETNLMESLENYDENLSTLVNGYLFFFSKKEFDGKSTRHNSSQDGVASYYFPSSVPYVQSAIEVLLKKSKNLTRPQIEKLKALREKLNLILISQVDREKGFSKGENPFIKNYSSADSLRYVNALSGLALISGLGDECLKLYNPEYPETKLLGLISDYDIKVSDTVSEPHSRPHSNPKR